MKKIIIYYPSKITGGAEFLLKTTADLLKKEYKVIIVDIESGWLSSNIKDVEIIHVSNKVYLDSNSILITAASLIRNIDLVFYGEFKLISWVLQAYNIIPQLPKIPSFQYNDIFRLIFKYTLLREEYKYFFKQINYLNSTNSIYIMDDGCNDVMSKYLGIELDKYLPVVIPDDKFVNFCDKPLKNIKNNNITLVWLGRLDGGFKNPILIRLIKDVLAFSEINNYDVVFNIIGDGPGFKEIINICKNTKDIEFIFHREKRGNELRNIILNSDIGFAMGTSALEIAACYTPTILLDASYGNVSHKYKYKWIFEEKGYCIGRSIDLSVDKTMNNKLNFSEIILNYEKDYASIGEKCYKYVEINHSEKILKNKLINAIENSCFSFADAKERGVFKKPFWHPLLILKNYIRSKI